MARDATARLYDVDENSVVFKKLERTEKYDQGTVTFRARKGKLVDLDKLHESIWATRLSRRTRSGLVSLDVTAVGHVVTSEDKTLLAVSGCDAEFVLVRHPDDQQAAVFGQLLAASGDQVVKLTGRIDNYMGRWPEVLRTKPKKPRKILVTGFEWVSRVGE